MSLLQKHTPNDAELVNILKLIKRSFAYMEDRINPPSSIHQLNLERIQGHCLQGEVWSLGAPAYACMFLTIKNDALYVGRIAVDQKHRKKGLARMLLLHAEARAKYYSKPQLELETRIELIENRHIFQKLGFVKVAHGTHNGFSRPTYLIMRKTIE